MVAASGWQPPWLLQTEKRLILSAFFVADMSCMLSVPWGVRADLAPRTKRHSLYAHPADRCPYQAQRRKPHLRRHAPHLAVLPFAYRQLDPRRRNFGAIADRRISRPQFLRFLDETRARGLRREVTETYAFAQPIECR